MYKLLLILKYLRKRRLAWWSVLAVALCVTMVLVVMSIMGGWIEMFQESFHGLNGDITIRGTKFQGMPYYQEIIGRMKAEMPELKDAAPVVSAYGVVAIGVAPGGQQRENGIEVLGYPPNIGNVNSFTAGLNRLKDVQKVTFSLWPDVQYVPPEKYSSPRKVTDWSGMIVGQGVIGIHRDSEGKFVRPAGDTEYKAYAYLTVMPHEVGGGPIDTNTKSDAFWIIDDVRTKVSLLDERRVYVPFDRLQKLLLMEGGDGEPARCSEIQISLQKGADLEKAKARIEKIVGEVRTAQAREAVINRVANRPTTSPAAPRSMSEEYLRILTTFEVVRLKDQFPYDVQTWTQLHRTYLGAIENERGLMVILFAIISIVAVFLIFCIFYMVVAEKTRDIGTIKSVGASAGGVAQIFVGYGAVIGIVGGLLGLLFSYLIVHNINELHGWLANRGWVIWNPEVYLFDTIPDRMNAHEVIVVVGIAIAASILGALVPAIRAARMNPVEALRWE